MQVHHTIFLFPSLTGPLNHLDNRTVGGVQHKTEFPSLTGPLNHLDKKENLLLLKPQGVSIPNGPPQPFRQYRHPAKLGKKVSFHP